MSVVIYNSLTKKKEPLEPIDGKIVRMYSCGITVYDKCHIGHARSLYIFEVIRRCLKYRGFDVRFVRNITDIDDKIINKAKELKKNWEEIVRENIAAYQWDLQSLGIPATKPEPRATENIDVMKEYITGLIEKGYAYVVDGDVYFRVRKFKEYGKLSGQSVDQMREAVRIDKDEKKEDPLDFALWKKSKEGEPSWPSPWGAGRPGWHIECSCMSLKHLKCQTLDIHAGGRDLIFPHHENEIAQAEAYTGKPFAKCWIHHGLLTINGQKMAKSLGNFITIEDALRKNNADDIKMFFLSSHYSSPIDFSEKRIYEANQARRKFLIFFNEAEYWATESQTHIKEADNLIKKYREAFIQAMDDDFNTPQAMGVLFELINEVYKKKNDKNYSNFINKAAQIIKEFAVEVFGFENFFDVVTELKKKKINQEIKDLLREREEARQKKDFKRSDEIRTILLKKDIIVEDTPKGQWWRPI